MSALDEDLEGEGSDEEEEEEEEKEEEEEEREVCLLEIHDSITVWCHWVSILHSSHVDDPTQDIPQEGYTLDHNA